MILEQKQRSFSKPNELTFGPHLGRFGLQFRSEFEVAIRQSVQISVLETNQPLQQLRVLAKLIRLGCDRRSAGQHQRACQNPFHGAGHGIKPGVQQSA